MPSWRHVDIYQSEGEQVLSVPVSVCAQRLQNDQVFVCSFSALDGACVCSVTAIYRSAVSKSHYRRRQCITQPENWDSRLVYFLLLSAPERVVCETPTPVILQEKELSFQVWHRWCIFHIAASKHLCFFFFFFSWVAISSSLNDLNGSLKMLCSQAKCIWNDSLMDW